MKFDHYGVPTTEDREGAGFHPVLRLNFSSSVNPLFRIEYLTETRHLGFTVGSIDETLKTLDCRILHPKIEVSPTLTICYVKIEDVVVELMERK